MRKLSTLFLAGALLCMPLYGCGANEGAQPAAAAGASSGQEDGTEAEERYDEIIADLKDEDYDGAIDAITEMKKEAQAESHKDMEKYLVTVELTPENFDEYFEWVSIPDIDAFGEQTGCRLGLRSKKYDDGLILYGLDDQDYSDSIEVEFTYTSHQSDGGDYPEQTKCSLDQLLRVQWGSYWTFTPGAGTVTIDSLDRIAGSKLTFIKKEFVESYDIEPPEHPDDPEDSFYADAIITLKNGETIEREIARDYPY